MSRRAFPWAMLAAPPLGGLLAVVALVATPPAVLAQRIDPGPPPGEAHPPIHIKRSATAGPTGYSPGQVRTAYGFPINGDGSGQTIAIVDAYDDPTIQSDLATFCSAFGLPYDSSTLTVVKQTRKIRADGGWALEIALDVEWAHAIAPGAKILLVEAKSNSLSDLLWAVDYAAARAQVVSMSWGAGEFSSEGSYDFHFNKSGVAFFSASGDSGAGVEWPAISQYVVSVGGTTLNLNPGGSRQTETGWSGSGGGTSAYVPLPTYQSGYSKRANPDVAYDADPNTGFSVYSTTSYYGQRGWFQVGGTSAGSPQWAALVAIADQLRGSGRALSNFYLNPALYQYGSALVDITGGSNGAYSAASGFDLVTGLGAPGAGGVIDALVNYVP